MMSSLGDWLETWLAWRAWSDLGTVVVGNTSMSQYHYACLYSYVLVLCTSRHKLWVGQGLAHLWCRCYMFQEIGNCSAWEISDRLGSYQMFCFLVTASGLILFSYSEYGTKSLRMHVSYYRWRHLEFGCRKRKHNFFECRTSKVSSVKARIIFILIRTCIYVLFIFCDAMPLL